MKRTSNAGTAGTPKAKRSAGKQTGKMMPQAAGPKGLKALWRGLSKKEQDFVRLLSEGMHAGIIEVRKIRNGIEIELKGGMPCPR